MGHGIQIGTNTWGNNFAFSNELKICLVYSPAIPFLRTYQWQIHASVQEERRMIFIMFVVARNWKNPVCLSIGKMNKNCDVLINVNIIQKLK